VITHKPRRIAAPGPLERLAAFPLSPMYLNPRQINRGHMALYLISYDIGDKDKFEYEPLWAKLRSLNATKILYSEWVLIDEAGSSAKIYDSILSLTTINDRLLVQELTRDANWDKLLISDEEFRALLYNARG
jgi:hypothetical protein